MWEAAADETTGKLPNSGRWCCLLNESLDATIQFINRFSYGTIKSSVPIIQCAVCSNDSQFTAVWTQKPPNSRNTSTLLFTLFWNQNIKLDIFCREPPLVLVHWNLWPSHLGSFAFLLSDAAAAVRIQSRAATKQPTDWQLVVTDCSVSSNIFYPATTFDVVVCFKAKLFSKVQIFPLYLYIFTFCPLFNVSIFAWLATASLFLPARATTGECKVSE